MSDLITKGDRVVMEGRGFGTVLDIPSSCTVRVGFDDDAAAYRDIYFWLLAPADKE